MNYNYTVYIHTNKINNKIYIGITSRDPLKRWQNGTGYRKGTYFRSAIDKYGWDNFEHEIIANNLTKIEAENFEKILIKKLQTNDRNKGYNLTNGGNGALGYKFSKEQRQKISENNKGIKNPMYGRRGINNPLYGRTGEKSPTFGRHHTEETKQKMSLLKKGKSLSDEHKSKLSEVGKGRKHTQEAKNKISKSHLGKNNPAARKVVQLDLDGNFIAFYETGKEAQDNTGIHFSNILGCCRRRQKTAGGFKWMYKEDYEMFIDNKNINNIIAI